jgi:hypothetical protein
MYNNEQVKKSPRYAWFCFIAFIGQLLRYIESLVECEVVVARLLCATNLAYTADITEGGFSS